MKKEADEFMDRIAKRERNRRILTVLKFIVLFGILSYATIITLFK